MVPAPSRARRLVAATAAALAGAALLGLVRGGGVELGLIVRPDTLALDVAAVLLAAATVGTIAPLVAGNHVPGLPARALALSWVGFALATPRPLSGHGIGLDPYWALAAGFEGGVLYAAVVVQTTTCWLVDTRITFPRIYPDPARRPPAKHTDPSDLRRLLLPHTLALALGTGLIVRGVSGLIPARAPAELAIASAVALWTVAVQWARPSRGSLWTAGGAVAGVALGTAWMPDASHLGAEPLLLRSGLVMGAALLARGLPRIPAPRDGGRAAP